MVTIRESVNGVKEGSTIGKWTVLGPAFSRGRRMWAFVCRCECGKVAAVRASTFRSGESTGCMRCHWWEVNGKHGDGNKSVRLYRIYNHMLGRCYCETDAKYPDYGARGITVCDEWRNDYTKFRDWSFANGYADDLTIDRYPNQNGNYEPDNCRWATPSQQARNTRGNRLLTHQAITLCVSEWAERTGIKSATIRKRLSLGWTIEKALMTNV